MQIRTTVQNKGIVNSILNGDEIILEIPINKYPSKFFKVKVTELTDDIQRCGSCNCLLHSKEDRVLFGKAIYCSDCAKRKRERMREIAAISAKKRKTNALHKVIGQDIQSNKK